MSLKYSLTAIAAAALMSTSAQAATTIVNGSFETGTNPGGSFTTVAGGNSTTITGWTVGGASVDYIGGLWQAQDGNRSIDLAGSGNGSIMQNIMTDIGTQYIVSYWIARNPDGGVNPRTGFIDVGGTPTQFTFTGVGTTRGAMGWEQKTYSFTATSSTTALRFSSDPATSGNVFGPALDNVSISAAVPEPATWAMMIAGFGFVGGSMRARRRNAASGKIRMATA